MNEDDYLRQLTKLKSTIKILEGELQHTKNRLNILNAEKDDLEHKYSLAKIKNCTSTEDWTNQVFEWTFKAEEVLQQVFKFRDFRSKQLAAINATLSKNDVILLMPTGGGKSLVYQLPAVVDKGLTLVVSPLISLIDDQLMALEKLGIPSNTLNGNTSKEDKSKILQSMTTENSKLRLLYVTPEWVAKSKIFMNNLQKCHSKGILKRIVIDEVHCCSTWGHDFRPEYNQLGFFKSMFPDIPLLGLTATATIDILVDIQKMLSLEKAIIITAPFNRKNLYYKVIQKPLDKEDCYEVIAKWLKIKYKDKSGIIYTATIKETEELSEFLRKKGLCVKHYHAQLTPEDKKKIHQRWLRNGYQAIVATIAFGMGIDKPDVRFVIHHAVPKSLEALYQETGRAGRDGNPADCILMFGVADYLRNVTMASSTVEEKNVKKILAYCFEQSKCRRSIIAEHFGDTWRQTDCNKMCDHCKYHPAIFNFNISVALKTMLERITSFHSQEVKPTLNKLVTAWLSRSKESKRKCSQEHAIYIIGYLIFKEYLAVEKGYTLYTTVAYIRKGLVDDTTNKIVMPFRSDIGFPKVVVPESTESIEESEEEIQRLHSASQPPKKKVKSE